MARLANVNTTDIASAVTLACRRMHRAEVTDLHNGGRYLNALLHAEDLLGVEVDEEYVDRLAVVMFDAYSASLPLPASRPRGDTSPTPSLFDPHNTREGLHGLYALVRYRGSARALELAEASIAAVFEYWDADSGWDGERMLREHGMELGFADTCIRGAARAIGPLVKLYRASGSAPALDLAIALKEKAVAQFYTEDGEFDGALFGHHVHSTTSTLSGLALLADLTGDSTLMSRVKAFYDHGLWALRDEVGWAIETVMPEDNPDSGETNSSGDILETALILAKRGHSEYYHDAERILRCHLLPSQLRDARFLVERAAPDKVEETRRWADSLLGAYGFPAPYGHDPVGNRLGIRFNLDVVGGTADSLCFACSHLSTPGDSGCRVNLLFDCETDFVRVESAYSGKGLKVTPKRPGPLSVRLPPWANAGEIGFDGPDDVEWNDGYLVFAKPAVDRPIPIGYTLVRSEIAMRHRTRTIRVRLRGDAVEAMDNFGQDLTYFEPIA